MFYRYYEGAGVPMHYGVRSLRHKLIYFTETAEWELYDLQADINELHNVYDHPAYAAVVRDMKADLERLCRELQVTDGNLNHYVPVAVPSN